MLKYLYKGLRRFTNNLIEGRGLVAVLLIVVNLVYLGNIRLVLAISLIYMFFMFYTLCVDLLYAYFKDERSVIKAEIESLRAQLKIEYTLLNQSYKLHSELVYTLSTLLRTHQHNERFYAFVKLERGGDYLFIVLQEACAMLRLQLENERPKISSTKGANLFVRQGVDSFSRKIVNKT